MELSEPEKRLVERELEILSDTDLVRWAERALATDVSAAQNPDIVDLASLPAAAPRKCESATEILRRAVVAKRSDFDVSGFAAQHYAQTAFLDFCSRFVETDMRPYDLCRVVAAVEQVFDYPAWLGDFFNQCDWCEPESSRGDFEHLLGYASEYVAAARDGK